MPEAPKEALKVNPPATKDEMNPGTAEGNVAAVENEGNQLLKGLVEATQDRPVDEQQKIDAALSKLSDAQLRQMAKNGQGPAADRAREIVTSMDN